MSGATMCCPTSRPPCSGRVTSTRISAASVKRWQTTSSEPPLRVLQDDAILILKLIQDIERLLIFLVRPALNEKGRLSCALHHREPTVTCTGEWPYPRGVF